MMNLFLTAPEEKTKGLFSSFLQNHDTALGTKDYAVPAIYAEQQLFTLNTSTSQKLHWTLGLCKIYITHSRGQKDETE